MTPPSPPPCSTGSCAGLLSSASTDPPTDFAATRTRPTPCARESTHVSPDPTHNDEELTPRPANYPACEGEFTPSPRQIYCSPRCKSAAHRRAPARPGCPHLPGLRGHPHRKPPTTPDLLLARMPSRVGKATQPDPRRRTSTTPRRTPPNPSARPAADGPRGHRPTGTDGRPELSSLRPARHDRRPARHPGSRPPHDHQPRHRHRPAQTPPMSFG